MPKSIAISTNTMWNITNFRSNLIKALRASGYSVVAITPPGRQLDQLKSLGCDHVALEIASHSINPGKDLVLLRNYYKALAKIRPVAYLGFTAKPNIYGSLAAKFLKIPTINNISGLGSAYVEQGPITVIVNILYKVSLSGARRVFFQNPEDLEYFTRMKLVDPAVASRLPGSGVDLIGFRYSPLPESEVFRFLLVARLLRDKGLYEYASAARRIRRLRRDAEFWLLGPIEPGNPNSITAEELQTWQREGIVKYLGTSDDVRPHVSAAHCVVLPSYREGTPRALLEAAAMGRVIITTNAPGCRETVEDGRTGFLCKPRDSDDLVEKMLRVIQMNRSQLALMGELGRKKMEREFDENIVIRAYLNALETIGSRS